MNHPLLEASNKELRKRVIELLKLGFTVIRDSNIVFVCGGNSPQHMRKQFYTYFADHMADFEFFEPEFAMENYLQSGDNIPFNIGDFEELVGRLSHSIVMFPEGPGSFAELGYFSMQSELAQKTVLVIDLDRQLNDSFISLGPAAKIAEKSIFQPTIYMDYDNPQFDLVHQRLVQRRPLSKYRKTVNFEKFSDVPDFDLFALIFEIVNLLQFATLEDVLFILSAIFKGSIGRSRILKLVSILVGSKRLSNFGILGHLIPASTATRFFEVKDGFRNQLAEVKISIAVLIDEAPADFQSLRDYLENAS